VLIRNAIGLKRRKLHLGNMSHLKLATPRRGVSASPASAEAKGGVMVSIAKRAGKKTWPERRCYLGCGMMRHDSCFSTDPCNLRVSSDQAIKWRFIAASDERPAVESLPEVAA
jgi:hypothetical protein